MSGTQSCKQCGCSEIDTDAARGDAVCTNCGCVLEESIIVSEVTFEEDGHGGASAVGQFVSAESRGGGVLSNLGGGGFHTSVGKESREITLRNTKKKIVEVAQQLRLNQHCIDVAFNFFKMALHKQLTKGRKNSLTIAACIYMTCRIEGTPHLLIDFSDVLQMDVYALGRAYVQISRSLYINIPAVDPCMYILRFAHKFELAEKTHDVAMTALRLVQRMKRDWIHLGRRPSGLCGAALLISARLHNFSRSVQDVIRVVKVHETTLRKRLVEFGETPSSSLTLDEFMSVDLEEEHDPPSYKAARIRDRERLQKLLDTDVGEEFKALQNKIDEELERRRNKMIYNKSGTSSTPVPPQDLTPTQEQVATISSSSPSTLCPSSPTSAHPPEQDIIETNFILKSTMDAINSIISDTPTESTPHGVEDVLKKRVTPGDKAPDMDSILMPPPPPNVTNLDLVHSKLQLDAAHDPNPALPSSSCMALVPVTTTVFPTTPDCGELDLEGIDDTEINGYIMTKVEVQRKTVMWENLNRDYIIAQKLKQEQLERDILEGKVDKKKKKKSGKAKPTFQAKSANEAIKIMLKERKISSKINYDVLRSLTTGVDLMDDLPSSSNHPSSSSQLPFDPITVIESGPIIPPSGYNLKRKLEKDSDTASNASSTTSSSGRKKLKGSKRRSSISKVESEVVDSSTEETVAVGSEKKPKLEGKPKHSLHQRLGSGSESESESTEKKDVKKGDIKKGIIKLADADKISKSTESVVESSQVHFSEEEDEDMDDEEEEDEASLSARDLLTQFRGEADVDEDDYYE